MRMSMMMKRTFIGSYTEGNNAASKYFSMQAKTMWVQHSTMWKKSELRVHLVASA